MLRKAISTVKKGAALLTVVFLIAGAAPSAGKMPPGKIILAFYNVENLYDTIPSPFYDDSDYTPEGRLRWDTGRYGNKLKNIAGVIDELGADVIGLAEVENEGVVKDLVGVLSDDYNYIHHTGGDRRGIDMAFLYKGDKFIPLASGLVSVGTAREVLHVRGEMCGIIADILVCHLPSQLNSDAKRLVALNSLRSVADSIHNAGAEAMVVVMGDFNATPSEKAMRRSFGTGKKTPPLDCRFFSPFERTAREGGGTYAYNNRWLLYDNIFLSAGFLSGGLRYGGHGIFVRRRMLGQEPGSRRTYPLRTFTSGRYTGGFSDHLPVYVVLETVR